MKFALASDLHLEFSSVTLTNSGDAEVLLLAGDVCLAKDLERHLTHPEGKRYREFFEQVSSQFKKVYYVLGNHEHYKGDFAKSHNRIKTALSDLPNVHLLQNNLVELGDNKFLFGATLWTDFGRDQLLFENAKRVMNDYKGVKDTSNLRCFKFLPYTALREHQTSLAALKRAHAEVQDKKGKLLVMTHHAPCFKSLYRNDEYSKLYYSDLEEYLSLDSITHWVHGHIHEASDYEVENTAVLANPRGYFYPDKEKEPFNFELKVFEF